MRVSEAFVSEFHVITGTIPHVGRASGEVTMHGVNKGTTILQLLRLLKLLKLLKLLGRDPTTEVRDDSVWNAFRRHGLV